MGYTNVAGKESTDVPPFVREKRLPCGGVLFSLGVQVRSNACEQVFCYQLKLAALT